MKAVEVKELTKRYGTLEAVKGISLSVEKGEIFGLLGPNGAGKTTTINILCTLQKATSGEAWVNGFPVARQRDEVRRSIGLVFQDPSLDDYLTAYENMSFHAWCYGVPGGVRRERIRMLLEMVQLWERRNDQVKTFSGGMKRRLEIARGLLHYPAVLFLDEPTLGLDPQTRRRIWEYIMELREQEGLTIVMTTHYMDEAEPCHRIAVIDEGRIVALDSPEGLKRRLGGDVVILETDDNQGVALELERRYSLAAELRDGSLRFTVDRGSQFIPELMRSLGQGIRSINLRRPTLDDVFLSLTGHDIRDEKPDSRAEIRAHFRQRGGPRR
ncbi:MAG: ATP-binding cassette domain-containing protein [Chloroflexi bacterium]|nr:ATP-binding cassette domain-containing protein [Chloroflexota bacterium]